MNWIDVAFWTPMIVFYIGFLIWGFIFDDLMGAFFYIFMGAFFSLIVGAITFGIIAWQTSDAVIEYPDVDLKSLNTSTGVEGRYSSAIFVSSGYYQSAPVYTFYAEVEKGQYQLVQVWSQGSRIFETNEVKPHVECVNDQIIQIPTIFANKQESADLDNNIANATKCDIYVPVGSIVSEYNPNFKGQ